MYASIDSNRCRALCARAALVALAVLAVGALTLPAAAAPAAPLSTASAAQLGRAVADRFDVLQLRSGPVLRPRGAASYHAVEFAEGKVAVDGETLTGDVLRRRLGDDYELITHLASLDAASRAEVLRAGGEGPAAGEQAEASEAPEPAERTGRSPGSRGNTEAKVSVGSSTTVEAGEVAHDVVVIGGSVDVEGEVLGDAVAVGGSVEVSGRVTGNVVAVGGGVTLGPHAEVLGDVSSIGGRVDRDPGAKVVGQVSEVALGPLLRLGALRHGRWQWHAREVESDFAFAGVARFLRSVLTFGVLVLLACLVVLLARTPLERVSEKVGNDPWRAGLTGLAAQVLFLPLAFLIGLVLVVSIIGIPLLIVAIFVVPVVLAVIGFLGYAAVANRLGRWSEARFGWRLGSPYVVALVGVAMIQIWTVAARMLDWGFFPMGVIAFFGLFFGFLAQYAAWTVGFGAVLLTRFGTQDQWRRPVGVAAPAAGSAMVPTAQSADTVAAEVVAPPAPSTPAPSSSPEPGVSEEKPEPPA
ncbi:MAG: hypothetical protein ACM3OB_01325 [Acidobacteriota bacterium]